MAKKIGEYKTKNELTGETRSHYTVLADTHREGFIMVRTTDGLEWYYALSNNEKNLLIMLWNWSNVDMEVFLGSVRRATVCSALNIGRRQISVLLGSLCENGYIKRLGRDDFLVNPSLMFKCAVKDVRKKIKIYEEYVVKHKNSDFYSE